jgi:hypothetical protein
MAPTPDTSGPQPSAPARPGSRRAVTVLALLALYALGIVHWGLFFHWGRMSFREEDWPKEHDYYTLLRDALVTRQVPYHTSALYQNTDRFLGLPETNLSPQVLLLPFLDTGRFLLVHTLLLFSLGYLGCLLLKRRYGLGLLPFTLLYLLFSFNGFITAHLYAGHSMWDGYFLLSFAALFTLEMTAGAESDPPALKLALVLFAMMLQGAFHLVIWWWMLLFLLALFNRPLLKPVLVAYLFSGWLSFFRLLPAAVTFWGARDRGFWSGYPTVTDVLDGLIRLRDANYPAMGSYVGRLRWWEYDMYVGLLGFALVAYFGVYCRRRDDPGLAPYRYQALDAPLLVLFFLSLNYFYWFVANLPVPLLNAEGVTSRFLIVPLVMLTVIASIRMQRVLETGRKSLLVYLFLIGALLQTFFALMEHSYVWRVSPWQGDVPEDIQAVDRPDAMYTVSIVCSALVSLAAVPVWAYTYWRSRRSPPADRQNLAGESEGSPARQ